MVKKKEDIPKWVTDEIQNAKFEKPKEQTKSGYILEIYDKDGKVDAQLYEAVEDGRHIVTFDLSKNIKNNYNKFQEELSNFSKNFIANGAETTAEIVGDTIEKT